MVNISDGEIVLINQFFEKFNAAVVKVLSQNLDRDIFKSFELTLNSSSDVPDVHSLKNNNAFYELDYVRGDNVSNLAVLIPEELISSITDVVMGGSGEGSYTGSLSELDINVFSELLPKIFKEIEHVYRKTSDENLAFDADPLFLTKANVDEYNDKFASGGYGFVVNYTLKVNSQKDYNIHLLLVQNAVKQLFTQVVAEDADSSRSKRVDSIGMSHLKDININISAELGRSSVPIKYALELTQNSMVELDTLNGEDISVFANGIEVAKAQIVVVEDNFGLRITKIVNPEERMKYI